MKKLILILFIVAGATAAFAQTPALGTLMIPYGSAQDTAVISKNAIEVKTFKKLGISTKGSVIQDWNLLYTSGKTNGVANGSGEVLSKAATAMFYKAKPGDTFVIDIKVQNKEGIVVAVSRKFRVK